jgi:hypothetical protein
MRASTSQAASASNVPRQVRQRSVLHIGNDLSDERVSEVCGRGDGVGSLLVKNAW